MRYQRLGKSDLNISAVCLGTFAAGGVGWGYVDPNEVALATRMAVADCGINFFDTADAYALGASETALGRALEGIRANVVIATKVGFRQNEVGRRWLELSATHLARGLEASLQRLGTDYVDLYLAHGPDPNTPLDEMAGNFERLREQGKVRWWGVCNFDASAVPVLAKYPGFVAYQGRLNLLEQELLADVVPACKAAGVAFLGYRGLGMGLLSGKYHQHPQFGADDFRSIYRHFHPDGFAAAQHGIAALRRHAWVRQVTMPQLALAWVLHEGATSVLAGYKSRSQVTDIAGAGDVVMSEHEAHLLREAFTAPQAAAS